MLEDRYVPADVARSRDRYVVLSGCSGSGKSAILAELARRGHTVIPEAGRQIIKEQNHIGGDGVPGRDDRKLVELSVSRVMHQMIATARQPRPIFFDRSIVDQVAHLEHCGIPIPVHLRTALDRYRYNTHVFMTPPWPEIFRNDAERGHDFEDAVVSYATLLKTYERLGYVLVMLPKIGVRERADFVLCKLTSR